jgi:transcriptional regulator of arginine metabolism
MQSTRNFMHAQVHPSPRHDAILRILRGTSVRKQDELVRLLRKEGHEVTQSSVSRDLRDLGVLKASGRYLPPPADETRTEKNFDSLRPFVRGIATAGSSITVLKTTIGAAQSVAIAIDKSDWPEVVGTISGDDTIFIATDSGRTQTQIVARLRTLFRI